MNLNQMDEFQDEVGKLLVRNRNILDILTKIQSSCARISRSAIKSATGCGCIEIEGKKNFQNLSSMGGGIDGNLCEDCRSIIETEIGEMLFYMASLCNVFKISVNDITENEIKRIKALGKYSLR